MGIACRKLADGCHLLFYWLLFLLLLWENLGPKKLSDNSLNLEVLFSFVPFN